MFHSRSATLFSFFSSLRLFRSFACFLANYTFLQYSIQYSNFLFPIHVSHSFHLLRKQLVSRRDPTSTEMNDALAFSDNDNNDVGDRRNRNRRIFRQSASCEGSTPRYTEFAIPISETRTDFSGQRTKHRQASRHGQNDAIPASGETLGSLRSPLDNGTREELAVRSCSVSSLFSSDAVLVTRQSRSYFDDARDSSAFRI